MHSVQKRDTARSSVEQRLSSFTNETWPSHPTKGDRIRGGARRDRNRDSNDSDEVNTDVEKGISKKISIEVIRDARRQG